MEYLPCTPIFPNRTHFDVHTVIKSFQRHFNIDSLTLFVLEVAIATILGDLPLWLTKLFLLSLGFWIRVKNFDPQVLKECKIVASNHTTAFDVFPFLQLFKLQVMIDKGFFQSIFAKVLTNIIGAIPLERYEILI